MILLEMLINPHGAGEVLAFGWFLGIGLVAGWLGYRVFRPAPLPRPTMWEMAYFAAIGMVVFLFIVMTFYVPAVLRDTPVTLVSYHRIAILLIQLNLFCSVALGVLLVVAAYVFARRRWTRWHWSFMWLAFTQAALAKYASMAALDRAESYDLRLWGYADMEVWQPWGYYLALGSALVCTIIGAGNMFAAMRLPALADGSDKVKDYLEQQLRWSTTLTERSAYRSRCWHPWRYMLNPFKVFTLVDPWRTPPKTAAPNAVHLTWLDWLVVGLGAFYGVAPPMWRDPTDSDDDDPEAGTHRSIDRT